MRTDIPLREITIEEIYKDVQKLRSELQTHNHLDIGNAQVLNGIMNGIVQSSNFKTGVSGCQINFATGVAEFQTIIAGEYIKVFAQDAIPTSEHIGDIWYDTNDDNHMYRAASVGADEITAGEWISMKDSTTIGATIGTDVKDEDAATPAQDLVVNWKKFTAGEAITTGRAVGFGNYNAAKTYLDTALWKDSYVDIDNADTNYGTSDNVKIGSSDDRLTTDGKRYYLHIDTDDIPEDFTKVLLKLWKLTIVNATTINFKVYMVTSAWTENAITWNNLPTDDGVTWVSGGFSGTGAFQEIDITSLILYWKAAIDVNYGLVIKCSGWGGGSGGSVTNLNTHSIEKTGGPEAQLSVEGLEDTGKIYLTDVTQAHSVYNFIGFAKENIASAAIGGVQILNVVSGLSGLKTNVTYFLGGSVGGLTLNPSHASGVVLKVGKALSATTLLMKEGQKMTTGSFSASSTRYEVIKTYFRPSKIEFYVMDEDRHGYGIAWGRTKQRYSVCDGAHHDGSDAVYDETGANIKVEIIAIYNAATLLKITYGGTADAKTINWVAIG